ncbi:MAG: YitT family protein [Lachnospiraceae bacterium]
MFLVHDKKVRSVLTDIFFEVLGSVLLAAATYNVALGAEFPMTGFSGISLILYRLYRIPIGVSTILLNIPVSIVCYKLIGKEFLLKSFRCMIISSVIIDHIAPLFPLYHGERMIAALLTGVLGGLGYAVIYMRNSSTGGADFIIMSVKALKPHVNLGTITFLSDAGIVLIGGIIFRDPEGIVYGLIINYLLSIVVDKVILGMNSGRVAFIVTENGRQICECIDRCCMRGSTILHGSGGYKGDRKDIVMVAGSNKDLYQIRKTVKKVDPASFIIIMESKEVHGEGFHPTEIAEAEVTVQTSAGE